MAEQEAAENPASIGESGVAEPDFAGRFARARRILYPVILLVLPFVFFLPGTLGQVMLGDGDAFVQFMPFWKYAADQWRQLNPPFWTPDLFGGFPLMAEPQAGVFHPNKLLFLVLSPLAAMNLTVLLYYGLAGLFAYLVAREEELTLEASLLAGIAFAYCGFLVGHQAITALFISAASFPVAFYVTRVTFRRGDSRSVLWGMLAVVFLVLNGHPQFSFYALFFSGFYAAYLLIFRESRRDRRIAFLKRLASIYILGAGLAAFQLLPTLELMLGSVRHKLAYWEFVVVSLPPGSLFVSLISTRLYHFFPNDGSEAMVDVGVWVLLLALLGCWLARKRSGFWIFLAVFSALLFVGDYTPLYKVMYRVPAYNLFRVASRNGIALGVAVAMLSAYWLTAIQARSRLRGKIPLVASVVVVPIIYFWTIHKPEQRIFDRLFPVAVDIGGALPWTMATLRNGIRPIAPELLLMAAGSALMLFLLHRFSSGILVGILGVSIAVSHFWQYRDWIFAAPSAEVQASITRAPLVASFPHVRDPLPSRIAFGGPSNWISFLHKYEKGWRRNYVDWGGVDVNMLHGISSISGYTPLILRDYVRFAGDMHMSGTVNNPKFFSSVAFDLLNVEYVIVPKDDLAFPPKTFKDLEIWQDNEYFTVYRNPGRFGYFWPVQTLTPISKGEFWGRLDPGGVDFSRTALLTDRRDTELTRRQFGSNVKIQGGFEKPTKIGLQVESDAEVFLASSQPFYPGWTATIDGKKTDVSRVNGLFCGLAVPAGSHRVVLRFIPVSFWIGLMLTVLSLAAWGALATRGFFTLSEP